MRPWLIVLAAVGVAALVDGGGASYLRGEDPSPSKPPWQRLLEGDDARKAEELEERREELLAAGKFDEALASAEELARLRQEQQGREHWQAVDARFAVAGIRRAVRSTAEDRQEYVKTFQLQGQAEALVQRGRYQDVLPLVEQVLAIRRKVLGEAHPDTATCCNNVAYILNAQGKYAEAAELDRRALEIRRKVLGEVHPHTAKSYHNLAATLAEQGKYAEAAESDHKALAIYRKVFGEEHPETAGSYNSVAADLQAQGQYAEAQEGMRKALAIRRKVFGEEHPDTAESYHNVAANLNAQGKYAEAAEVSQKALAIRRKVFGEEHPHTAESYNSVAFNLQAQGKYAEAAPGFRKALDIRRKVLGEEHPYTAESYDNVAANLNAQGKYTEAEESCRKALEISRKVLGEEHPSTAGSYSWVAFNLSAQGKYAEATPSYRKALDICRKVHGEEHPQTALSYNNLAANLSAQGQYAEAAEGLRKALAIRRKVLGEEHPDTVNSYNNLAANLNAQGKYTEAEELWLRAARSFATARLHLSPSGLERATLISEHSPLPPLSCVVARNGKPEEAWRRYEESLSRGTWDDLSARLRRPAAERARQAELVTRLQHLDQRLEKALAVKEETPQQKKAREELLSQRRAAQEELDAFVHHLDEAYGPAAGQVFDLPRIQAGLGPDMALVGWLDIAPAGTKAADTNGEHWAFLLRSSGAPLCLRLKGGGPTGEWTEDDIALPAQLRTSLLERRGDWRRLARRLSEQRLKPLEGHLAAQGKLPAVRHLVVLPSPALAGVPLETLAEEFTISYALSGTLHTHLKTQPAVKGGGLLALGDPIFDTAKATAKDKPLPPGGVLLTLVQPGSNAAQSHLRPDDVLLKYGDRDLATLKDLQEAIAAADGKTDVTVEVWRDGKVQSRRVHPGKLGVVLATDSAPKALAERYRLDRRLSSRSGDDSWRPLPGTRVEVESLRRLFPAEPKPLVLYDTEASEQKLDALAAAGQLGKYRYVHLATHGEVDNSRALRSAIILSRDSLPDRQEQLLAGKPIYDGRLTAEEMLRSWNLEAELVTLSACESALGKYERGEGFVGFAQALILCGSRSVCLSLWKVDDSATALLMQRFYANLLGKRDGLKGPLLKAAALREAKEWLRNLSRAEALKVAAQVSQGVQRGKGRPKLELLPAVSEVAPPAKEDRPYAHPYYWAAFVLTGDPD
jgi:tetratricopeptide (TPR) repeat protein